MNKIIKTLIKIALWFVIPDVMLCYKIGKFVYSKVKDYNKRQSMFREVLEY